MHHICRFITCITIFTIFSSFGGKAYSSTSSIENFKKNCEQSATELCKNLYNIREQLQIIENNKQAIDCNKLEAFNNLLTLIPENPEKNLYHLLSTLKEKIALSIPNSIKLDSIESYAQPVISEISHMFYKIYEALQSFSEIVLAPAVIDLEKRIEEILAPNTISDSNNQIEILLSNFKEIIADTIYGITHKNNETLNDIIIEFFKDLPELIENVQTQWNAVYEHVNQELSNFFPPLGEEEIYLENVIIPLQDLKKTFQIFANFDSSGIQEIRHKALENELLFNLNEVESYTSALSAITTKISGKTLTMVALDEEEQHVSKIIEIATSLGKCSEIIYQIAANSKSEPLCCLTPELIKQIRLLNSETQKIWNSENSLYSLMFLEDSNILVPAHDSYTAIESVVYVLEKIGNDVETITTAAKIVINNFRKVFKQTIYNAIKKIIRNLTIFKESFWLEGNDDTLLEVSSVNNTFCVHKSIVLFEQLKILHDSINLLEPDDDFIECCNERGNALEIIRRELFIIFKYLKIIHASNVEYSFEFTERWLGIFEKLGIFFQDITPQCYYEPIKFGQDLEEDEYNHANLDEYFKLIAAKCETLREGLYTVVQECSSQIPTYITASKAVRVCSDIPIFFEDIITATTKIHNLINQIDNGIQRSDWGRQENLCFEAHYAGNILGEFINKWLEYVSPLNKYCNLCQEELENQHLLLTSALEKTEQEIHLLATDFGKNFCCNEPKQEIKKINEAISLCNDTLVVISQAHTLPSQNTAKISEEDSNNIKNEVQKIVPLVAYIRMQIEEIKTKISSAEVSHPCYFQDFLPNIKNVREKIWQIPLIMEKIAKIFDSKFSLKYPQENVLENFQNSCEEEYNLELAPLQESIISLDNLLKYDQIVLKYDASLCTTISEIFDEIAVIANLFEESQWPFNEKYARCQNHRNVVSYNSSIEAFKEAGLSLCSTLRSSCCSEIGLEASKTKIFIENFISILNYFCGLSDTEYSNVILPLQTEICTLLEQANLSFKNVFQIIQNFSRPQDVQCQANLLIKDWKIFNNNFQKANVLIAQWLNSMFSPAIYLKEVTMVAGETLKDDFFSKKIQEINANFPDMYASVSNLKNVLSNHSYKNVLFFSPDIIKNSGEIFSTIFDYISYIWQNNSLQKLCSTCPNPFQYDSPEILIFPAIVTHYTDIYNLLTAPPSCCSENLDYLVKIADNFNNLQKIILAISNSNELIIPPENHNIFIEKISEITSCLAACNTYFENIAIVYEDYAYPRYCCQNEITVDVQSISSILYDIFQKLQEILPMFKEEIDFSVPQGFLPSGAFSCEQRQQIMENIFSSFRNFLSSIQSTTQAILRCQSRIFNNSIVEELKNLHCTFSVVLKSVSNILDKIYEKSVCSYCYKIENCETFKENLRQIPSTIFQIQEKFYDTNKQSLIGSLERYCSSVFNEEIYKLAEFIFLIAREIACIGQSEKFYEATFSNAISQKILPCLTVLENTALICSQLEDSLQDLQPEDCIFNFCSDVARKIRLDAQSMYDCLKDISAFLNIETASYPAFPEENVEIETFYLGTNLVTDFMTKALERLCESAANINFQMRQKKQKYAYNQRLYDLLGLAKPEKILSLLGVITQAANCPYDSAVYFSQELSRSLKSLGNTFTQMQELLIKPNCCSLKQNYLEDIINAKIFIEDVVSILNVADVKNIVCNIALIPILDDLKDSFVTLNDFYKINIEAFLKLNKNLNCFRSVFDISIDFFLTNFLPSLKGSIIEILKIWNIDFNERQLSSYHSDIDCLNYRQFFTNFITIFEGLSLVGTKIFTITASRPVIFYDENFCKSIELLVVQAEQIPCNFYVISQELALMSECSYCDSFDCSFSQAFKEAGDSFAIFYKNLKGIHEEIQKKCCSEYTRHLRYLALQSKRFETFFSYCIHENPKFISYFFNGESSYEFLTYLSYDFLKKIADNLAELKTFIIEIQTVPVQRLCYTSLLKDFIENLAIEHKTAADKCKEFYYKNCFVTEILEDDVEKILYEQDLFCPEKELENILLTYTKILSRISELVILQESNFFETNGREILIEKIQNAVDRLRFINRIFDEIFTNKKIFLCKKCYQSNKNSIQAINLILSKGATELEKINTNTENFECCSSFVRTSEKTAKSLKSFLKNHKLFIKEVENEIKQSSLEKIYGNETPQFFTATLCRTNEHFEKIVEYMRNLVSPKEEGDSENQIVSCRANSLLVDLSYVETELDYANNNLQNLLKQRYPDSTVDEIELKIEFSENANCENRPGISLEITELFNEYVESWQNFEKNFTALPLMIYQEESLLVVNNLRIQIIHIRNLLQDWGELVKNGNYFCLKCLGDEKIYKNLLNCFSINEINVIFQNLEDHLKERCCNFRLHILQNINQIFIKMTENTIILAKTPLVLNFIFEKNYIEKHLLCASSLLEEFQKLSNISSTSSVYCNSEKTAEFHRKTLSILSFFGKTFEDFCSLHDIEHSVTEPFTAAQLGGCGNIGEQQVMLVENFNNFVLATDYMLRAFYNLVNKEKFYEAREIFFLLGEAFKTLMQNTSLDIFGDVNFCKNNVCITTLTLNIREILKKLVFLFQRLQENLTNQDCCYSSAEFLYNISFFLKKINKEQGYRVPELIIQAQFFSKIAEGINEISYALVKIEGDKEICSSNRLNECFLKLIEIMQNFVTTTSSEVGFPPKWEFVANLYRNKCSCIPTLYRNLTFEASSFVKIIYQQNAIKEDNPINCFDYIKLNMSLEELGESLKHLLTTSKKLLDYEKIPCRVCQYRERRIFIENLLGEIEIVKSKIANKIQKINILKVKKDLEKELEENITTFQILQDDWISMTLLIQKTTERTYNVLKKLKN